MMSTKKYRIRLTTDEQQELNALVSRGRAAAYKQTHARILLMSDESRSDGGMKDADITSALGVGQSTVERIRKRCVEEGVECRLALAAKGLAAFVSNGGRMKLVASPLLEPED